MKTTGVMVAGLLTTLGLASAQTPMKASNPYVTIKSVTACYYPSRSANGSTGWFPAIMVKFVPKVSLDYAEIKGTFINMEGNESLGKAWDNGSDFEAGVTYTLKTYAESGWSTPKAGKRIKINPVFNITKFGEGRAEKSYTLPSITKFPEKECLGW